MSRGRRARAAAAPLEQKPGEPFRVDVAGMMKDLQKRVKLLEDDLREQVRQVPDLRERLGQEYNAAQAGGRTQDPFASWLEPYLTQVAVAWVLSCVFVRYMEDNGLLDRPFLAGPGERLEQAQDALETWFRENPRDEHRDYLQHVFRTLSALPGCRDLLGEDHNPLWLIDPSGDAAKELLDFFQQVDPDTDALRRMFGPGEPDADHPPAETRFLGDLYQDLSEAAKKRYALLQTPEFIEEFILDRTLEPAIEQFGLAEVRLIDPTCGSGHFLLGAFHRLLRHLQVEEPGTEAPVLADRALSQVFGVDLNPFAVAISRFRLLVAAVRASGYRRLREARDFRLNLAAGDSLLYCRNRLDRTGDGIDRWVPDPTLVSDFSAACEILRTRFHAVVGNPPYIVDRDKTHNPDTRARYATAYRQYSLGVPFTERFFELAVPKGFVGVITTNSFMKREFGKKLIEEFLPTVDLSHVLDTSGAYIPGHGTPTVMLFGRNRAAMGTLVRAALGIRGEPAIPTNPAEGLVWSSIAASLDLVGSENEFVSIADVSRGVFSRHPWSIGGGGAAELKAAIEEETKLRMEGVIAEIGFGAVTRDDEVYLIGDRAAKRQRIPPAHSRPMVAGENVRDWGVVSPVTAIWPYDPDTLESVESEPLLESLWPWRTQLSQRVAYGLSQVQRGLKWSEYSMLFTNRFRTPLAITFAEVATHNHFVLDRGGRIFNRTAPVIKLPPVSTEGEHLALCGLLNSSTGEFWAKQVFHNKGGQGIGEGLKSENWERFYQRDGTKLQRFPIPEHFSATLPIARLLDYLSQEAQDLLPAALCARETPSRDALDAARRQEEALFGRRVALQEELDWFCYGLFGILGEQESPLADLDALPEVRLGERAFEIAMARQMAAGQLETTWFERHGSAPITHIPDRWPERYREIVERRLVLIESNSFIRLLEKPEHKRRWKREPWEAEEKEALRSWLLDRLESPRYWPSVALQSCSVLADAAVRDSEFLQVAALYAGRDDFDPTHLVSGLVTPEAVPYLAPLRYAVSGLRKSRQWEEVWDLQRREDRGENVGTIPVPPKYGREDFRFPDSWRLRGKLDVPKERFTSYPGAERGPDPTLVVGWAGWDTVQRAEALASWYVDRRDSEGWDADRLLPLLAGLQELVPWLLQWHNDPDPELGAAGDYFGTFVDSEARRLGTTAEALKTWKPEPSPVGVRRRS